MAMALDVSPTMQIARSIASFHTASCLVSIAARTTLFATSMASRDGPPKLEAR